MVVSDCTSTPAPTFALVEITTDEFGGTDIEQLSEEEYGQYS